MKREFLDAVLDDDLRGLLKSIGQLEHVEEGEVVCCKCGTPITLRNLQLIIPLGDSRFDFVCSDPPCVEHYYEKDAGPQ